MGTVGMRSRLMLAAATLAIAVPSIGHASTQTLTAPWLQGTSNQAEQPHLKVPFLNNGNDYDTGISDPSNQFVLSPQTGMMGVIRLGVTAVNGTLGCSAHGPFANYQTHYAGTATVNSVTVHIDDAYVDAYTWVHVGVLSASGWTYSIDFRGPIVGSADLPVDLRPDHGNGITEPVSGPFDVEFGFVVPAACPNVDGGVATFTSVAVDEA